MKIVIKETCHRTGTCRVVTVVGLHEKMSSVKRVTLQVPGRVLTLVGVYESCHQRNVSPYRYLDESLRWMVCTKRCHQ